MALNHLQEPRDMKIVQSKYEVSHFFYLDYFLHVVFRAIFEAFSYIVLLTAKIVTQSSTYLCHVLIVIDVRAAYGAATAYGFLSV